MDIVVASDDVAVVIVAVWLLRFCFNFHPIPEENVHYWWLSVRASFASPTLPCLIDILNLSEYTVYAHRDSLV